ncbi:Ankyrin repeat protein [Pandoravirus kuranda]|uniref:Ankyrin repeat protein n=1 Tax=Pandoravirus kuranda TaxID=3019033 RepID=A0AA95EDQ4_9VIRU|nr:Ankyrin repeat protein [Pandoravirus kuranda]
MEAPIAEASGATKMTATGPNATPDSRRCGTPLIPKGPLKRDDPHDPDDGGRANDPRRRKRPRTDGDSPDLCGPAVLSPEIVALVLDALLEASDVAACIASGVFRAADDEALRQRCRRTKKRDLIRAGDTEALAYMRARRGARFEWSHAVTAASSGRLEALRWIWVHADKGYPCDILSHAARHGHIDVVQWLLQQADHRWTDIQINRAIVAAVSEGHGALVDYLCETNGVVCTPAALATAVVHGRLSIAKMLHRLNPTHARAINAGTADLYDMITPRHNPGLHGIGWRDRGLFDLACVSGHLATVEFVWQSEHNKCTRRILMCAAGGRNPDVVRFVARNRDAIEARVASSDPQGVVCAIDSDPTRVLMIAIPSGDVPTLVALRELFPAVGSAYMGGLLYLTNDRDMVSFVLAHTGHPDCHAADIDLAAALGVAPNHPLPQHQSIGRLDLQTVRYACEIRGYRPTAADLLDSVSSLNMDVTRYLCDQHGLRSACIGDLVANGADRHTIAAALADDLVARAVDTGRIETIRCALDAWLADRQHEVYHIDAGLSRAISRHREDDRHRIVEYLLGRRRRLSASERAKPMVLAGNGVLRVPVDMLERLHSEWDVDIDALVAYDDCIGSASVPAVEWARQRGHDIIAMRHAQILSALVWAAAERGERRLVEWFAARGWRPHPDGLPTPWAKHACPHHESAAKEIFVGLTDDDGGGD